MVTIKLRDVESPTLRAEFDIDAEGELYVRLFRVTPFYLAGQTIQDVRFSAEETAQLAAFLSKYARRLP